MHGNDDNSTDRFDFLLSLSVNYNGNYNNSTNTNFTVRFLYLLIIIRNILLDDKTCANQLNVYANIINNFLF